MKKLIAMLLALTLALGLVACGTTPATPTTEAPAGTTEAPAEETTEAPAEETTEAPVEDTTAGAAGEVMTYADFMAAELEAEVVIETYVQNHQSWWEDKITVYCQDEEGAYFLYELACTEEDAAKLVPGTKIRVTGYKAEWAGEVEIMDGTFEFVEADPFVVEAKDYTDLLGSEEMLKHQNELAAFSGMTVEKVEYKNGEPGDDIYVTLSKDGNSYNFCVEVYLTNAESDVYKTVGELKTGDVVNVEGFLYWYEGMNPHITNIEIAE